MKPLITTISGFVSGNAGELSRGAGGKANDAFRNSQDVLRLARGREHRLEPVPASDAMAHECQSGTADPPGKFIGTSAPMQAIYQALRLVARSEAPVFVTGESGTGKELCADAIHQYSARKQGPFIAVNCAAIPIDLLESQLFGHLKGAFTGAVRSHVGYAAAADGGTLFLDEVAELSLEMQGKLLRFLQTGHIVPVGATTPRAVNCRIVCATNADPTERVRQGRFREDLYYRLHVVPVMLPPLRERDGDVIEIARALLECFAATEKRAFQRLGRDAEQALLRYSWPGNVRELENVIRRAVVMHDGAALTEAMLNLPVTSVAGVPGGEPVSSGASSTLRPLWMVERDAIEQAIVECAGNIPRAAAILEVAPSTLYRKRLAWKGAS